MRLMLVAIAGVLLACLPAAAEAHGGWGFSYHYAPPPPPCYHYCPPPYPAPVVHYHHHGGHHHYGHGYHRPRVGLFFGF
jgi:hypothetical protein